MLQSCPALLDRLMTQCWQFDRRLRPSFRQVVDDIQQCLTEAEHETASLP